MIHHDVPMFSQSKQPCWGIFFWGPRGQLGQNHRLQAATEAATDTGLAQGMKRSRINCLIRSLSVCKILALISCFIGNKTLSMAKVRFSSNNAYGTLTQFPNAFPPKSHTHTHTKINQHFKHGSTVGSDHWTCGFMPGATYVFTAQVLSKKAGENYTQIHESFVTTLRTLVGQRLKIWICWITGMDSVVLYHPVLSSYILPVLCPRDIPRILSHTSRLLQA